MMWTLTPEEDPETGDLIVTLPTDLLFFMDWRPGDRLNYSVENQQVFVRNLDAETRQNTRDLLDVAKKPQK